MAEIRNENGLNDSGLGYYTIKLLQRIKGLINSAISALNITQYLKSSDAESTYVQKDGNKGLSTNDYTDTDKAKLSEISSGAQVNVIESIKVNNATQSITNKSVNISVPTKVSELNNDSGFTSNTGTVTGITMNGQSKGTSGNVDLGTVLTEHQSLAGLVADAQYVKNDKKIYFKNSSNTNLFYVDTTDFVKDGMIENVSVTNGSLVISFNTDAGKQNISIPITDIFNASNYYTKTESDNTFATKSSIPTKVSELTNDSNFTSNVGTITGIKMNGVSKGTSGIVDLGTVITAHQDISGKANAADLATVATTGNYNDLSNKPDIPTSLSSLSGDATHRLVTDTEKSTWNAKYSKPSTGIPATDLAQSVQDSLTAANNAIPITQKGAASGVAPLDGSGKINDQYLPDSLDDVEHTSNKVTTISSASTDTQYPSAKCMYDVVGDIETALDILIYGQSSTTITKGFIFGYKLNRSAAMVATETCVVSAFLPILSSCRSFTCKFSSSGEAESDCSLNMYNESQSYLDYWLANSNPRTITYTRTDVRYLRATFKTAALDDCYIYDNTNSVFIFKGANVSSI